MPNKLALNHRLNRRARTRVGLALLVGLATFLCLPQWLLLITRLLIGWNAGVVSFLGLAYAKLLTATPEELNHHQLKAGGLTIGGLNRRLEEKAAGSRWFAPRAERPSGGLKPPTDNQ